MSLGLSVATAMGSLLYRSWGSRENNVVRRELHRHMHICLIMDNPETPRHPVIGAALRKLSVHHTVRLLDVRGLTNAQSLEQEQLNPQADLYLLKSHAPQALDLASQL